MEPDGIHPKVLCKLADVIPYNSYDVSVLSTFFFLLNPKNGTIRVSMKRIIYTSAKMRTIY